MDNNYKAIRLSISTIPYKDKNGIRWADVRYLKKEVSLMELRCLISEGYCFTYCYEDYDEEFGQSDKTIENFRYTQVIGVDIDDSTVPMRDYIQGLDIKPTMAYTTRNNKVKGYRFRLLYAFNQKIIGKENYGGVYRWLTSSMDLKDDCMARCNQQMAGNGSGDIEWWDEGGWLDIPKDLTQDSGRRKTVDRDGKPRERTVGDNKRTAEDSGIDKAFLDDLYALKPSEFIDKYRHIYTYFTHSELIFNDKGYALIGENYYEIHRVYRKEEYKNGKGETKVAVRPKTLRDGEGRRNKLFKAALVIRNIKPDISVEHLVYILVCERYHFYDNSDRAISNRFLVKLARQVVNAPFERIKMRGIDKRSFIVDKGYCAKIGVSANQYKMTVRKMLMDERIGSLYDRSLSDRENLEVMKGHGLSISPRRFASWKKENDLTRAYNRKNSPCVRVEEPRHAVRPFGDDIIGTGNGVSHGNGLDDSEDYQGCENDSITVGTTSRPEIFYAGKPWSYWRDEHYRKREGYLSLISSRGTLNAITS